MTPTVLLRTLSGRVPAETMRTTCQNGMHGHTRSKWSGRGHSSESEDSSIRLQPHRPHRHATRPSPLHNILLNCIYIQGELLPKEKRPGLAPSLVGNPYYILSLSEGGLGVVEVILTLSPASANNNLARKRPRSSFLPAYTLLALSPLNPLEVIPAFRWRT